MVTAADFSRNQVRRLLSPSPPPIHIRTVCGGVCASRFALEISVRFGLGPAARRPPATRRVLIVLWPRAVIIVSGGVLACLRARVSQNFNRAPPPLCTSLHSTQHVLYQHKGSARAQSKKRRERNEKVIAIILLLLLVYMFNKFPETSAPLR